MLDNARCRATTRDRPYYATQSPVKPNQPSPGWSDDTALHFLSHSPAESFGGEKRKKEASEDTPEPFRGRFFMLPPWKRLEKGLVFLCSPCCPCLCSFSFSSWVGS